ncbi:MAG: hypothetical protein ABWY64_20400 [Tardiphaga sp.]
MTDTNHTTRFAEPFRFSNREFVANTLPTLRAASLFANADQATVEDWLRELTATPEGLAATFDLLRNCETVRQRFMATVDMLDTTGERINATLVAIGRVKSA